MSLYDKLRTYRESIGAPWFTKPWDLNLVVIRSGTVGVWDDLIVICCLDDQERRVVQRVRATGDAWEGEWTDPTHPDGCVYVLDGHYPSGLKLGYHKGRDALRQNRPFSNVRWPPDKMYVPSVDELEELAASGAAFTDVRGTHIHDLYTAQAGPAPPTDGSEGCIVSMYRHQHVAMIELVRQQLRYRGSNVVSPTFVRRNRIPA